MHPEAPVLTSKFVIDYFSDGNFCPLDAPGHAVGNLNALVRTSVSPDTFMLLGGDAARHDPLPESIALPGFAPNPCPAHLFEALHANACATEPLHKSGQIGHDIQMMY
jgi:hypothetical protein